MDSVFTLCASNLIRILRGEDLHKLNRELQDAVTEFVYYASRDCRHYRDSYRTNELNWWELIFFYFSGFSATNWGEDAFDRKFHDVVLQARKLDELLQQRLLKLQEYE